MGLLTALLMFKTGLNEGAVCFSCRGELSRWKILLHLHVLCREKEASRVKELYLTHYIGDYFTYCIYSIKVQSIPLIVPVVGPPKN